MSKNKEVSKRTQQVNNDTQYELPQMSLMGLLQFGSQTLLVEAIKAEISEVLGRGFYQRCESEKDFKGYRHGTRKTTLDTPIGPIVYERPRVNGLGFKSQFHVPYMRRPNEFAAQICDMYVNGTSTRKVKSALKSVTGDKIKLSKSTVSRITKALVLEFKEWKKRDLSDLKVSYLFFDAIRVGMRIGGTTSDSVMIAYAILEGGSFTVLSIDISHSESNKSWGRFISDLKVRGLKDPILSISDGNTGVINSIEASSINKRFFPNRIEEEAICLKPFRFGNEGLSEGDFDFYRRAVATD